MDFDDLDKLSAHILKTVASVMDNEVAEVIKKVQSDVIKRRLYQEFQPNIYRRRKDEGGLSDIRNMKVSSTRINKYSVVTTIKNMTKGNPKYGDNPNDAYIGDIIASGKGYQYHTDKTSSVNTSPYYERERPIDEYTVEEIERTRIHVSTLIAGLKLRGIDAE